MSPPYRCWKGGGGRWDGAGWGGGRGEVRWLRVHAERGVGGGVAHMCKWLLCKPGACDARVQMCRVHVWGLLCAGCKVHTRGLGL